MGLERFPNEALASPDKYSNPTADVTLGVQDQIVRPAAATAITITLPPVAEAKGKWYSIINTVDSGAVTVADQNDSYAWPGDMVLADTYDAVLLYSDGQAWFAWLRAENAPS